MRAKIAGRGPVGPTELRHLVMRVAAGDTGALGGVSAPNAVAPEVWDAVHAVYGASFEHPEIDPDMLVAAALRAGARVATIARAGGRIGFATSAPACLLGVHAALARLARTAGADVLEADDSGPIRVDGRSPRWIRWIDGVATVTDRRSLIAAEGPDAPSEWLFQIGRPALVVADGCFAEAAAEAGIEVVAASGLDRIALAVPATRPGRCLVIPVHTTRPPRHYRPLVELLEDGFGTPFGTEM